MALDEQEIKKVFNDMATGIMNLNNNRMEDDDLIYDISGRVVNKNNLTSGIYIHKGKKLLVK